MKKDTLLTISSRTGYSVSTISRVLSGKGEKYRISASAIELIEEEARKIHFVPNLLAKSLRTNKTFTIGLTVPAIDNPFFATLASIVMEDLKERGYHTLLVDSAESEEEYSNALNIFISRNVDGVIAVPVGTHSELTADISSTIPTILIDRYFEDSDLPFISTDNYRGGYMAAEYLISCGYKRILSIQGVRESAPNRERIRGVLDAVKKSESSGISIDHEIKGNAFSEQNGYREIINTFSGKDKEHLPYDAVFAYSSTILLGAIRAFKELGIRIPHDIGIISYDNNGFFDYLDPPITRIEQPLTEIGHIAAETLIDMIEGECEKRPIRAQISPTLVIRSSCRIQKK